MPRLGVSPDLVTFNTLLNGFCIRGEIQEAQDLLVQMLNSCSPGGQIPKAEVVQDNHVSSVDSSALVTETEVGELLSMELLQGEHLKPNHITHTALISAYCRAGKLQ